MQKQFDIWPVAAPNCFTAVVLWGERGEPQSIEYIPVTVRPNSSLKHLVSLDRAETWQSLVLELSLALVDRTYQWRELLSCNQTIRSHCSASHQILGIGDWGPNTFRLLDPVPTTGPDCYEYLEVEPLDRIYAANSGLADTVIRGTYEGIRAFIRKECYYEPPETTEATRLRTDFGPELYRWLASPQERFQGQYVLVAQFLNTGNAPAQPVAALPLRNRRREDGVTYQIESAVPALRRLLTLQGDALLSPWGLCNAKLLSTAEFAESCFAAPEHLNLRTVRVQNNAHEWVSLRAKGPQTTTLAEVLDSLTLRQALTGIATCTDCFGSPAAVVVPYVLDYLTIKHALPQTTDTFVMEL